MNIPTPLFFYFSNSNICRLKKYFRIFPHSYTPMAHHSEFHFHSVVRSLALSLFDQIKNMTPMYTNSQTTKLKMNGFNWLTQKCRKLSSVRPIAATANIFFSLFFFYFILFILALFSYLFLVFSLSSHRIANAPDHFSRLFIYSSPQKTRAKRKRRRQKKKLRNNTQFTGKFEIRAHHSL